MVRTVAGCSTPFGITEVGTWRRCFIRSVAGVCAQRLSASQRWALKDNKDGLTKRQMCSTPFGITEVGTRRLPLPFLVDRCAQRLSASQRWAPVRGAPHDSRRQVLNAFRHHRGGHELRPAEGHPVASVLNAFRHHRGGHAIAVARVGRRRAMCSTPFGITEVGTAHSQPTTIPPLAARLFKGLVATSRMARAMGRAGGAPAF